MLNIIIQICLFILYIHTQYSAIQIIYEHVCTLRFLHRHTKDCFIFIRKSIFYIQQLKCIYKVKIELQICIAIYLVIYEYILFGYIFIQKHELLLCRGIIKSFTIKLSANAKYKVKYKLILLYYYQMYQAANLFHSIVQIRQHLDKLNEKANQIFLIFCYRVNTFLKLLIHYPKMFDVKFLLVVKHIVVKTSESTIVNIVVHILKSTFIKFTCQLV
eukprot:TRINITY_DN48263_c0_g1_i12.p2 TRINITY_DN48263_c0_g1~~TRINITY_DN48263_c0_g1_i12.p2  ORF type:complete len:216 (+),score=-29.98 TRINITY_DN48263_c0_g1_i12:474-1121(+)